MLFHLLMLLLFHVFNYLRHGAKNGMHSLKYFETGRVQHKLVLAVTLTLFVKFCLVLEERLLVIMVVLTVTLRT